MTAYSVPEGAGRDSALQPLPCILSELDIEGQKEGGLPPCLPEKVKLQASLFPALLSLPNGIPEHVVFIVPFPYFTGCFRVMFSVCLVYSKLKTGQSFSARVSPSLCKCLSLSGGSTGGEEQAQAEVEGVACCLSRARSRSGSALILVSPGGDRSGSRCLVAAQGAVWQLPGQEDRLQLCPHWTGCG